MKKSSRPEFKCLREALHLQAETLGGPILLFPCVAFLPPAGFPCPGDGVRRFKYILKGSLQKPKAGPLIGNGSSEGKRSPDMES